MAKYQVELQYSDGTTELDDEVFTSRRDAEEHGMYLCSCYRTGCEVLNLSNPGDYPLDEDDDVDFEVIRV